jgi:hypothetical protein
MLWTWEKSEISTKCLLGSLEERNNLEDVDVDGRITLKRLRAAVF